MNGGLHSGTTPAGSLAFGYQGADGDRSSGEAGCGGFGRQPTGRFSVQHRDFVANSSELPTIRL
jgi:hypothetical protein